MNQMKFKQIVPSFTSSLFSVFVSLFLLTYHRTYQAYVANRPCYYFLRLLFQVFLRLSQLGFLYFESVFRFLDLFPSLRLSHENIRYYFHWKISPFHFLIVSKYNLARTFWTCWSSITIFDAITKFILHITIENLSTKNRLTTGSVTPICFLGKRKSGSGKF